MTDNTAAQFDIPYVDTNLDRLVISFEDRDPNLIRVVNQRVPVQNGRHAAAPLSLDREGFLLEECPSIVVHERLDELVTENAAPRDDEPLINQVYAHEMLPMIQRLSGAREVFAQFGTTTVRFSDRAARRSWLTTAAFAHMDFSPEQADSLVDDTCKLTGRTVAPYSRHVLYQTWRVLTDAPQDRPLALCDGRSATIADMVPMEFHGPAGTRNALIKSRAARYSPAHRWSYFPAMTRDEVLVFKGFDSAIPDSMNAMHTSFLDDSAVDPVPRGSVECRFIALYD